MVASASDLSLVSVAGNAPLDLKNRVFGGQVISLGFRFNRGRWKGNERLNFEVRAAVDVGVEGSKSKALQGASGLDVVSEGELTVKGFAGLRKTKLVCTVGPACSSLEELENLALGGMSVARLNMCHGTTEWHRDVIRKIKKLNKEKGFCVSVMIDTEGSQIHVVDHGASSSVKVEVCYFCFCLTFTSEMLKNSIYKWGNKYHELAPGIELTQTQIIRYY